MKMEFYVKLYNITFRLQRAMVMRYVQEIVLFQLYNINSYC